MSSFLLKEKTKTSFMKKLLPLSFSTKENYKSSLKKFDFFCLETYQGRSSNEIITELKTLKDTHRDEAFYEVLQGFVNWLITKGLSNTTVNQYSQIITFYLSYHGIRVHASEIRQNVRKPRKIKEKLHALTKKEILRIFDFTPEFRKMLYLTLIGSGMRIQECVALRKKDFDLQFPKRTKIEIPAQYTKSLTSHTTFVSKEASKLLKPHLESLNENDLVFATNPYPFHAKMTEIEAFARYRKRAGLIQKYESTKRHHITLHSFRAYFFTNARRAHDTDIAHAMVGHTTYLGMYDRKTDSEMLELYLKAEPSLKIY